MAQWSAMAYLLVVIRANSLSGAVWLTDPTPDVHTLFLVRDASAG